MYSNIKIHRYLIALSLLVIGIAGSTFSANAQTLGVVWTKDYPEMAPAGAASSLTPQPLYYQATNQARYLLTGTMHSRLGFIAILDETGNVLRKWEIPVPSYYNKYTKEKATNKGAHELVFFNTYNNLYRNTDPDDVLASTITSAVMKPDGSILAFGYVLRHNAIGWQVGEQDFSPGSHANCRMKTGVWKIRIDAAGNVIENTTARGAEAYKMLIYNDKILLPGLDIHETGSIGALGKGVGMLHEYDLNGNFVAERCPAVKDEYAITGARKMPNGDIFLDGWYSNAHVMNGTTYAERVSFPASVVYPGATNVPLSGTGSVNGGFFVNPQFSEASDVRTGSTFAKINPNGTLAYRMWYESPDRTKVYNNPLVLDAVNHKYVGTVNINGANMMYILTDKQTSFEIIENVPYPNNTALQDVSLLDGFFSMANNTVGTNRVIAIAKLSPCANFKLDVGKTERGLMTGEGFAAQTITYDGNQPNGTITWSWTLKDVTASGSAIAELATEQSGTSNVLPAQTFTLLPGKDKGEAEYVITAVDTYDNNGTTQTCSQTYTIKVEVFAPPAASNLFSDDVWFFGNNQSGAKTSRGIVFRGGVAYDYSGVSMVDSWENSLSVSTPACDGSFIFYVMHDKVYNSKHEVMDGGTFLGNSSNSDGLAACYIGDNKYMLFGVSSAEAAGKLNYYYIDMSQNNGLGKMTQGGTIDVSAIVNEAIELLPKAGAYDKYWLVYHAVGNKTTIYGKLRVIEIDGSKANPIGNVVCEIDAPGPNTYYGMRSNTTFDRIAISVRDGGYLPIYKFNPIDGQLSHLLTIQERAAVYGTAFSPNGRYVYAVPYSGNQWVRQYEVETGAYVGESQYNTGSSGSGMKLGPDGRIYISRENVAYMAVIENPDVAFDQPGGGVTLNGFPLSRSAKGLTISVGLTPPWISPPSSNHAPSAVLDEATSYGGQAVTINPILNDSDPDNDEIYLVNAELMNHVADAHKGTVTFDEGTKTVTFTPKPGYNYTDGETVQIRYQIRDNGIPVAMCVDNGVITITLRKAMLLLTLTPTEVNEGETITAKVCLPEGMVAPAGGFPFTLAIDASSEASADDITGSLSGTIPATQDCYEFTITAKPGKLIEGDEDLALIPTTTVSYFTDGDAETVTIKDRTLGDIVVEKTKPSGTDQASEPSTDGEFTVRFKEDGVMCTNPVKVKISLAGSSAQNGVDYETVTEFESLEVTLPPNTHKVTLPIIVKNNFIVEDDREIIVTLTEIL
ncbi:MAG: hypothetical protein LBG19_05455 [Prevotellaceae bacterium]|jgi:hypothetical protein|nr:hypothetical protein [Prevotellaceae bacterium]